MRAFWQSSGHHLLKVRDDGRLAATDDFLRAYLMRPELHPVEESCKGELSLHAALMEQPRRPLTPVALVGIQDSDIRENYGVYARFRDHLLSHDSIESAYLALFTNATLTIPPLFIDQLTHAILKQMLADCVNPLWMRAAECLFRTQKVTIEEGSILLADEETVEMHAQTGGLGNIGRLLVESDAPLAQVELDVLNDTNTESWWDRSNRFDTVLDASFTRPGLDALCRVMERWLQHMLSIDVSIQPLQMVRDEKWIWHTGLDSEATDILNDLYHGEDVDTDRQSRLLSLFRLEFRDPAVAIDKVSGRPVYLAMAMDEKNILRLKPQNLLVNLPLRCAA